MLNSAPRSGVLEFLSTFLIFTDGIVIFKDIEACVASNGYEEIL